MARHESPPEDPRSDGVLLAAADRDGAAFGVFHRRWSEAVAAYCLRRTLDSEATADLVAEVFAVAYLKRRGFRDDGRGAGPWLYGIARRELGRYRRRRGVETRAVRRLGVSLPPLDDESVRMMETLVDLVSYRRELAAALDRLTESERAAIRLRVVEERPYPEVARLLDCSEGAARVRVHRGLHRLADWMEAPS